MIITLLGLNHRTAPIELRERLHIAEDRISDVLHALRDQVREALIFSTCNRFEILTTQETQEEEQLVQFISEHRMMPRQEFESCLYHHSGSDAVRHVFRVTSSLDSMVIGEPQILGQMKNFFSLAQKEKAIGFTLNSLMERAFTVAKKVRTETAIASNAVSISSVAVELAMKIFGKLEGKTAFIIGAGKMSVLAIKHLQSRGIRMILVTNRTFSKAAEIAEQVNGRAVPFDTFSDCLAESDIVISSTGSPNFIIKKEQAMHAMAARKHRPMFFIDIAVPRDIDPEINKIDNIFLYDIDDLKTVSEKNRYERRKEAEKAEEIVSREADIFWSRLKSHDIAPTIREIQTRIEDLRRSEIERTIKRLGPLTEQQKEAIEEMARSLTGKLSQSSFAELRNLANQPDGLEKIELIKKLFKL